MSKITEVAELVEKGKAKLVGAAVQSALDEGCEATEILNSMIDAMACLLYTSLPIRILKRSTKPSEMQMPNTKIPEISAVVLSAS